MADVLSLQEIDQPSIKDDEVLVRIHAASLNALDWHYMTGTPYLMRLMVGLRKPKRNIIGVDLAGTVESVGCNVTRFNPGDEVFGAQHFRLLTCNEPGRVGICCRVVGD